VTWKAIAGEEYEGFPRYRSGDFTIERSFDLSYGRWYLDAYLYATRYLRGEERIYKAYHPCLGAAKREAERLSKLTERS
jgi:hypothetical protein